MSTPGLKFTSEDYRGFLECVHCGLCLPSCPTYAENGNEADSPRGRIYLMKNVADGRLGISPTVARHLDLCLGCMACQTACPSGVHYGQLIEKARSVVEAQYSRPAVDRLLRRAMAAVLPYPTRLELALLPVRMLRAVGLGQVLESAWLRRLMPRKLQPTLSLVPVLPPLGSRHAPGEFVPAEGKRRYRVALLTGCVMSVLFSRTNQATARVLARNGCDVLVPRGQVCCGSLHLHMGFREEGLALARANLDAFSPDDVDAILINAAGCGAMMKEYDKLFAGDASCAARAESFTRKTKDMSEFLASIDLNTQFGEVKARAVYHDACHLAHAQKVRTQPRQLLQKIPGLELVPLAESDMCCGSAGPYNLVEPEMAQQLLQRKMDNLAKTGAQLVVTGNPGCILQIAQGVRERGLPMEVCHTVDVLDRAYQAARVSP
ncbi:MAG: 4Fe-4S dicluster domain-containing protein [Planctomycetes bacterium]|nr:4Fe-4S dicluster domain-containing protein [Planctomycetota bacterium]